MDIRLIIDKNMKAKKLITLLTILSFASTTYGQGTNEQQFKKLTWLVGKWNRTNAKAGESGYETWEKVNALKLTGKGVTLKEAQVVFLEHLELSIRGSDIVYAVRLKEEKTPIFFKLTEINKDGFTCENPQHDFPKKIVYKREGENVKAIISGNGESIDFNFTADH